MATKEKLYKDLPRPKLNRAQIADIYRHLQTLDPAPRTELDYTNVYTLVVAVALSAQSTEKMVALGEDVVRDHIKTIGLYKNKAKNVIKLSQMLIDDFGSEVPDNRDDLVKLPGVGQPTMAVDYPYLSRVKPHGHGARQKPRRSRAKPAPRDGR